PPRTRNRSSPSGRALASPTRRILGWVCSGKAPGRRLEGVQGIVHPMGRQPAPETRRKRRRMVASQLAARGIRDCRVLAAMAWVPREWFLPPHLADEAYEDAPLPLGPGQTISQPYIVALMPSPPGPRRGHRLLQIVPASGHP